MNKSEFNTANSDVNELYFFYLLNGKSWSISDTKSTKAESEKLEQLFSQKSEQIGLKETNDQKVKSKVMVKEFKKWASNNRYSNLDQIWWTSRPGDLSKAVGEDIDSTKNPTDVLVKFSYGPSNGFLGVSLKSTKGNKDVGFKNPGVGTIDKELDLKLGQRKDLVLKETILDLKLHSNAKKRKVFLRAPGNEAIRGKVDKIADQLLSDLRDDLLLGLKSKNQSEACEYIIKSWINADSLYPPYIKITGFGGADAYAKVENPRSNEKLEALQSDVISFEKVGRNSVGVKAGNKKIMKMRLKFESQKLASSLKLNGDPWS